MKMTLFLGAGASVFAEMPTTKRLVRMVQDNTFGRKNWESPGAKRLAVNIIKAHIEKDVEELYSTIRDMIAAEMQHRTIVDYKTKKYNNEELDCVRRITTLYDSNETVKDETTDTDETIRTLESLERDIRDTLLNNLMVGPRHLNTIGSTYSKLFKFVSHIVTTNYDNVLETYCEQAKLNLVNGFKSSYLGYRRIWSGAWEDENNALHLIKLHGSITWQKDGDGTVLEIGRPGLRGMDRDVMIAPTLGKKDYGNDIFPALLNRFETVLGKTELLVVVGFSFRDPEINRILRCRLERTDANHPPMRLLYVDPKPERLKNLIGSDVDMREVETLIKGTSHTFFRNGKPYVEVYKSEFNKDTVPFIANMLNTIQNER